MRSERFLDDCARVRGMAEDSPANETHKKRYAFYAARDDFSDTEIEGHRGNYLAVGGHERSSVDDFVV